jgi:hypothetical protein
VSSTKCRWCGSTASFDWPGSPVERCCIECARTSWHGEHNLLSVEQIREWNESLGRIFTIPLAWVPHGHGLREEWVAWRWEEDGEPSY